jgi:hypothetical protein
MQFGGSGATGGKDSGFCITIARRVTSRLSYSSFSLKKKIPVIITQPPYSLHLIPNDFLLFLLRKWAGRGLVSQWMTSDRMRRPSSGRFQKKPSAGAYSKGRIDGRSMCAHKGCALKAIRYALPYVLPLQCNTTIPELFDCPLYCISSTMSPFLLAFYKR